MNNGILIQIGRFIVLILAQVLILNDINFLGYLNPYIYIIFILLAPININRSLFLVISFALGLTIDVFGDSGGIHAAACITAAYIRPLALRSAFGLSYEFQTVKLGNTGFGERLVYVTIMVVAHHILLFALEIFSVTHALLFLKKTLFSSIFTMLITMLILVLFRRNDS